MKRPVGFDADGYSDDGFAAVRKSPGAAQHEDTGVAEPSTQGTPQQALNFVTLKPKRTKPKRVMPIALRRALVDAAAFSQGTTKSASEAAAAADSHETVDNAENDLKSAEVTDSTVDNFAESAAKNFAELAQPGAKQLAAQNAVAEATAVTLNLTEVKKELASKKKAQKQRVRQAKRKLAQAKRTKAQSLRSFYRGLTAARRMVIRRLFIALALIVGFAGLVGVALVTPAMSVAQIEVRGLKTLPEQEVLQALEPLRGKPLAFVSEQEVHAALGRFTLVQRYSVQRIPPGQLVLELTERTPVMVLKRGEEFFVVDAAGVELEKLEAAPSHLPLADKGTITSSSSKAFLAAATVLRDMPESLRSEILTVTATGTQDITFGMRNGLTVRWGNDQETVFKAVIYEKMLGALAGRQIKVIDVSSTQAPVFE